MAMDLTQQARDGFHGVPFDHQKHGMLTSPAHAAYCLGEHLRQIGGAEPTGVRPGRGDLMHANGILWRLNWTHVRHPVVTIEAA